MIKKTLKLAESMKISLILRIGVFGNDLLAGFTSKFQTTL